MTSAIIDLLVVEAVFLTAFIGIISTSMWHKADVDSEALTGGSTNCGPHAVYCIYTLLDCNTIAVNSNAPLTRRPAKKPMRYSAAMTTTDKAATATDSRQSDRRNC